MHNNALASIMQKAGCRIYVDECYKTHRLFSGSDQYIFTLCLFLSGGIQSVYWVQSVLIQLSVSCHMARREHSSKHSVVNIAALLRAPATAVALKVGETWMFESSISDNHAFKQSPHLIK